MSATIKVFHIGDKCFRHVMSSYDLVELRNENDETLLTYSDNSRVFDRNGRRGSMSIDYIDGTPRWVYCETQNDVCVVLGADHVSAEVEISRRYIMSLFGT